MNSFFIQLLYSNSKIYKLLFDSSIKFTPPKTNNLSSYTTALWPATGSGMSPDNLTFSQLSCDSSEISKLIRYISFILDSFMSLPPKI